MTIYFSCNIYSDWGGTFWLVKNNGFGSTTVDQQLWVIVTYPSLKNVAESVY